MALKEIKKNEVGKGLLVEKDAGYIDPFDSRNEKAINDLKSIGSEGVVIQEPLIMTCILQKHGIKNANGRIYPENILRREWNNYLTKVKEKRAYGECYTPDTLILTESGWKELRDAKEGENILTLNPHTNIIEIKPIIRKISYHYEGNMIRIKGNNINDLVTPNHKYPIYDRTGKFKDFYTAQDIYDKTVNDQNHSYIPKQGKWIGVDDEFITLKGIDLSEFNKKIHHKMKNFTEDLKIPTMTFMKFLGIYLSEGCVNKKGYGINIYQKKESISNEIVELLNELGLPYIVKERKDTCKRFTISDVRIHNYLHRLGICYHKYIPQEIKQLDTKYLTVFYDWFVMGDGRMRGSKTTDVFSTSKQLVLDLNEIQLKIGYSGNYHEENRKHDRYIKDHDGTKRLIKGENCSNMYFTLKSLTKGIYLDKRFLETTEEQYNGEVMCVEVENHTWYCMCNNKAHWTGNCNHPSQSEIDLSRIAINVVEGWWEGSTLLGKIEIIMSPGFVKLGIISCQGDIVANLLRKGLKIGVSSRGLGSVKQIMGNNVVQDDFELVCWDAVADPSTPGAYIFYEDGESKQYVESTKKDKNKLIEGIDKFLQKKSIL